MAEGVKSGAVMTSLASAGVFFFLVVELVQERKKGEIFRSSTPAVECFFAMLFRSIRTLVSFLFDNQTTSLSQL